MRGDSSADRMPLPPPPPPPPVAVAVTNLGWQRHCGRVAGCCAGLRGGSVTGPDRSQSGSAAQKTSVSVS